MVFSKQRFLVLSKGITVNLMNTQAVIVACAVLHNISIDMKDELSNDFLIEDNNDSDTNVEEDNLNLRDNTRSRQERNWLIMNYFANLE